MRGLKHFRLDREHHRHEVASFTDAWIETNPDILIALSEGRIFYRCVD